MQRLSHIELLIFDLDGTLVDFPYDFFWSETHRINEILKVPFVEKDILQQYFSAFDYFRFFDEFELERDRSSLTEEFWFHFDWDAYPKAVLLDGTMQALAESKKAGYKIALATARAVKPSELQKEIDTLGIGEFFDYIATRSCKDKDYRDKSEQISNILGNLNVSSENALLIGDIPADIIAAQQSALAGAIAVLSGRINRNVLEAENPLSIHDEVSSVVSWILKHSK